MRAQPGCNSAHGEAPVESVPPFGFDGPLVLCTSLIVKDLKVDGVSFIGETGHVEFLYMGRRW